MTLDELIEALERIREQASGGGRATAALRVLEPGGVWFGDFPVEGAEYVEGRHEIALRCSGLKTNFIKAADGSGFGASCSLATANSAPG